MCKSVRIQKDFFLNQDGTQAKCCHNVKHGACGVALVDPEDALPWVRQEVSITQDELGLLILGRCPVSGDKCQRLDVPAVTDREAPVLLSCCFHQLGQKDLVFKRPEDIAVTVQDSVVVSVTVFSDEVDGKAWNMALQAPVRGVFDIMKASGSLIKTKTPPWGRTM